MGLIFPGPTRLIETYPRTRKKNLFFHLIPEPLYAFVIGKKTDICSKEDFFFFGVERYLTEYFQNKFVNLNYSLKKGPSNNAFGLLYIFKINEDYYEIYYHAINGDVQFYFYSVSLTDQKIKPILDNPAEKRFEELFDNYMHKCFFVELK